MAARGCGTREAGGIYACCGLANVGMPVEWFLCDPERMMRIPERLRQTVSPLGVHPIYVNNVDGSRTMHIVDWVGSEHYPFPVHFIEEARLMGVSRRLPDNNSFPWEELTRESRLILIHARTIPKDPAAYHADRSQGWVHCLSQMGPDYLDKVVEKVCLRRQWAQDPSLTSGGMGICSEAHSNGILHCPTFCAEHRPCPPDEACAGLWWEDLEPATNGERYQAVEMPSFTFHAASRPQAVKAARWTPGFFARFPIAQLEVIRGNGHDKAGGAFDKATLAHVPVVEMDE